jgi:phospholipid/cholesterol/gamma-HCH transport system ATP-binding protein
LPDSNSKDTPSEPTPPDNISEPPPVEIAPGSSHHAATELTSPDDIPQSPLIETLTQDDAVHTSNAPPASDEILVPPPIETIAENAGLHPPQGPYIAFEHVSKSFGSLTVLNDVSFFVLPGETLCILGRSGVGKSVSLQQIMGFLKPDSGQILVAGDNIAGYAEEQMQVVRKKVTMVFQNGALFDSLTVGENVAFPLRERGELIEDQIIQIVNGLLEMVGVAGMADLLPSDLSTGMKRSVAIARALSSQPEAILYDEPTTMVDPLMGRLLGDLIQKLKYQLKLTSIVVTHDMRFAQKLADRVLFLHEAKAHFFGTMPEMEKSEDPIIRQFLELDALVLPA